MVHARAYQRYLPAPDRVLAWFGDHWAALLAFFIPMVVYLITLAPTFFGLDSAEFSAASYKLSIPHATGYPLYILLGKLFTYLPVGDIGYRINLMSAVFAAGSVGVLYLLLHQLTARVVLSLAMSLFLAFSYYFWITAVVAEVYTLHALFTGLILLALFQWYRKEDRRLLYVAVGVWGLSFGNQMATVLLAPAFGFVLLEALRRSAMSWRDLVPIGSIFFVGLLTYALLPVRYLAGADVNAGAFDGEGIFHKLDLASIQGMWAMLTGKSFGLFFFPFGFVDSMKEFGRFFWWLLGNFLGIGVVLGLLGMVRQAATQRRQFIVVFLAFLFNVVFFANYGAIDKYMMFHPAYLVWTLWIAIGFAYLLELAQRHGAVEQSWRLGFLRGKLRWEWIALVLPLTALIINFSYADVSADRNVSRQYTSILESLEPNALYVGWWPDTAPLVYLQQVEGMRRDVWVVDRFLISREDEAALVDQERSRRPVYVFGHIPPLTPPFSIVDFWHGSRVLPLSFADQ